MNNGPVERQQSPQAVAFSFFSFFKDQRAGELRTHTSSWLCYSRRMKELTEGLTIQLACGSSCAHRSGGEMLPSPAAASRERDARDERRRKRALAVAKLKEWQNNQPHTQFAAFTDYGI